MNSFELNKILGAILGTCLVLLSLNITAGALFSAPHVEKPGFAIAAKEESAGGAPQQQQALPPVETLLASASAEKGQATAKQCGACHSPSGDLQGIGTRIADAKVLQNVWVSGGAARMRGPGAPTSAKPPATPTATITLPTGETASGRLVRLDDFSVTIAQEDGTQRSFRRKGDVPKVDVKDPLQAHRDLLAVYTDKNMHDVTAYLASLK